MIVADTNLIAYFSIHTEHSALAEAVVRGGFNLGGAVAVALGIPGDPAEIHPPCGDEF